MLPTPRIIAIDDDPKHLEGLAQGLNQYGAACLPVHFTGETEAIPTCRYIRVIFADLHLGGDTPGDHAQNFSVIGGLIEETIKPSGPYLIVLWTKYPDQAADLECFLRERLQNVAKPFAVQALDKNNHLDPRGNVRSAEALVDAIRQIVEEQPQVGALLDWEDQVLGAAADTLSSIMKLAEPSSENISRLLASLAVAAVGTEHVEENRFRAVNETLLPILADHIATMRSRETSDGLWQASFKGTDIEPGLTLDEAAKLNSLLHIAPPTNASIWAERGAVIPLPQRAAGQKFARTFGIDQKTAAYKSFGCRDFTEHDDQFRWVLVQTQAACDYAQMRSGPLPFHLGLCFPTSNVRKGRLPAALWTSPIFDFDGLTLLNINAGFQISLSPKSRGIEKPLFRLREQLLNDLIYQLHGYGARPGIISFRES